MGRTFLAVHELRRCGAAAIGRGCVATAIGYGHAAIAWVNVLVGVFPYTAVVVILTAVVVILTATATAEVVCMSTFPACNSPVAIYRLSILSQ